MSAAEKLSAVGSIPAALKTEAQEAVNGPRARTPRPLPPAPRPARTHVTATGPGLRAQQVEDCGSGRGRSFLRPPFMCA